MNVLVIGCGRLGSRLASILDSHGHDVAVVDADADSFHNLGKEFNGITVVGMPMDVSVLQSAGVEGCDAMAVVTPDDNLNITVSQIAREFFGIENVVARISDPLREKVFKSFGLKTICPTKLAGDAMFTALARPWESRSVTFGTSTVMFHTRPVDRAHEGMDISAAPRDSGETVFGVVHPDGSMTLYSAALGGIPLAEGDRVVFSSVVD